MPFNEASFQNLDKGYKGGFHRYLNELEQEFQNFEINKEIYFLPNDHFGDRSHVNRRGVEAVMKELKTIMER
jgi:hypothetical protein